MLYGEESRPNPTKNPPQEEMHRQIHAPPTLGIKTCGNPSPAGGGLEGGQPYPLGMQRFHMDAVGGLSLVTPRSPGGAPMALVVSKNCISYWESMFPRFDGSQVGSGQTSVCASVPDQAEP